MVGCVNADDGGEEGPGAEGAGLERCYLRAGGRAAGGGGGGRGAAVVDLACEVERGVGLGAVAYRES